MPKYPVALMITLALALLSALIAVLPPPLGNSTHLLAATITGAPERRIALVIGNGAYQETPRRTSVHDAVDMAAALGQLGFQVVELHDATEAAHGRSDRAVHAPTRQRRGGGVLLFGPGRAGAWAQLPSPSGRPPQSGVRPRWPGCTPRWGGGPPAPGRQWVELHHPGRRPPQPFCPRRAGGHRWQCWRIPGR